MVDKSFQNRYLIACDRKKGEVLVNHRRWALFLVGLFLVASTAATGPVSAAQGEPLSNTSEVVLEAKDPLDSPMKNARVVVRSLTDNKTVFEGETDAEGKIRFVSRLASLNSDKDVEDSVYRAYLVAPTGELVTTAFAVPHLTKESKLSAAERQLLNIGSTHHVKVAFPGEEAPYMNPQSPKSSKEEAVGTASMDWYDPYDCFRVGWNDYVCERDFRTYQRTTRLGKYAVSDGLTATVTVRSTARTTISLGYKSPNNTWTANGSVTLTNGSTDTWTLTGQCVTANGTYTCHPSRTTWGHVRYEYREFERYVNDQLYDHWYEVTPVRYIGGANVTEWLYEVRNGRSPSAVRNGDYGDAYEVWNEYSRELTYSTDFNFSIGATVPTPVGTFSPSAAGHHTDSNSLRYSTNRSGRTYVIYDFHTDWGSWYTSY